jgi:hypothetical protein
MKSAPSNGTRPDICLPAVRTVHCKVWDVESIRRPLYDFQSHEQEIYTAGGAFVGLVRTVEENLASDSFV